MCGRTHSRSGRASRMCGLIHRTASNGEPRRSSIEHHNRHGIMMMDEYEPSLALPTTNPRATLAPTSGRRRDATLSPEGTIDIGKPIAYQAWELYSIHHSIAMKASDDRDVGSRAMQAPLTASDNDHADARHHNSQRGTDSHHATYMSHLWMENVCMIV